MVWIFSCSSFCEQKLAKETKHWNLFFKLFYKHCRIQAQRYHTCGGRPESALWLHQLGIVHEDQPAIEVTILSSHILHRILSSQSTDPSPDDFPPPQISSHRQERHLYQRNCERECMHERGIRTRSRANTERFMLFLCTCWLAGIPGGASSINIGESSDWTACMSSYSWSLCIATTTSRLNFALDANWVWPSAEPYNQSDSRPWGTKHIHILMKVQLCTQTCIYTHTQTRTHARTHAHTQNINRKYYNISLYLLYYNIYFLYIYIYIYKQHEGE